jgi:2-(1,2-epoxy-1,2-dihydrophenyl)acetyl-CoA isomerase
VSTDTQRAGGELLFRVEDGVAWLTLNRPDAGNALNPTQRNAIIDLLRECDENREVRAIVVGSTGVHFCSGADLRVEGAGLDEAAEALAEPVASTVMKMIAYGANRLMTALQDCQKPVLASVQGTAAGLGVQLALACDLVIMAEEASFIEVFVRRGLVPDGGTAYLLTRLAGLQRAKELMMLGDRISSAKAREYGLVTEVVALDQLGARTAELAARLAQGPTVALGLMKRLANRAPDSDRDTSLFEESLAQELNMSTFDAREGIASFVERRASEFRGS